jgi:hypothetical protein
MTRPLTDGLILVFATILSTANGFAGARSLENPPDWTVDGNQASAYLSTSIATAGDVNGDGYSDVLVAAPLYDNGETDEGKVWLYLGSSSGLSATATWTAEGNQAGARFGSSVSTAGDVNDDGYDDVVIGAELYDNGQTDEGRAFLYLGSATGLSTVPAWTAESNQPLASFGCSVSTAGDVNGDGYDDVIVGASQYDNVQVDEGRAYLFRGNAGGLGSSAVWTGEANLPGAAFGSSVSTAGDVNGDGYDDVIVGAYLTGTASIYLGNSYSLGSLPVWQEDGDGGAIWFGYSVSAAGDVDGDGYADVVVGAPLYANGQEAEGKVYLYRGSADGPSATPAWTAEGDQIGAGLGSCVSLAGDTNGDGFSDVIVGAKGFDNGEANGRAGLSLPWFHVRARGGSRLAG